MADIRLAKNLTLPAEDFIEAATGIAGRRSRGKTGAVKVLMEELVRLRLPFVALDPVGIMWGVKSSFDGKGPGLPVLVIGGQHGDLKLDRKAGALIARAVVGANISCVIDFSDEPKSAYREFVRDFANELYAVNNVPRLVILGEAPELVPQVLRPDMTEVFDAVERLVLRGRNKGIGVVMETQRPAVINKNVFTQVDALLVFGVTSPQDRKALKEWVEARADITKLKEFEDGLAGLQKREAWYWHPDQDVFQKVYINDFHTFHPDKTHLRKMHLLDITPVTTDVSGVITKLGAELDRFKKKETTARTVEQLEKKIAYLESSKKANSSPKDGTIRNVAQKQIDYLTQNYGNLDAQFRNTLDMVVRETLGIREKTDDLITQLKSLKIDGHTKRNGKSGIAQSLLSTVREKSALEGTPFVTNAFLHEKIHTADQQLGPISEPHIKRGARRILEELAANYPLKLTRSQLATRTGFSMHGGTFQDYFRTLKRVGYIEDADNSVMATPHGLAFAQVQSRPPVTHEDVMRIWQRALKSGNYRLLVELTSIWPESITCEVLAVRCEQSMTGGTFQDYLRTLKRNGLVEVNGDRVKASDSLFPEK